MDDVQTLIHGFLLAFFKRKVYCISMYSENMLIMLVTFQSAGNLSTTSRRPPSESHVV